MLVFRLIYNNRANVEKYVCCHLLFRQRQHLFGAHHHSFVLLQQAFYSLGVTKRNKGLPQSQTDKQQWSPTKTTTAKVIKAHQVSPKLLVTPENDALSRNVQYLRNLSSKNFFLRKILSRPLELMEWLQQPKQKKIDSVIRTSSFWLLLVVVFTLIHSLYLLQIYEKHEITDREFLNFHSQEFIEKEDDRVLKKILETFYDKVVPASSATVKQIDQVLAKLIKANKEFVENENFDPSWSCIVLDEKKIHDLLVIDTTKFVITTLATIELCQNEHQLAYVLANALAHFLLKHRREPFSNLQLTPYDIWTGIKIHYFSRFFLFFSSSGWFEESKYFKFFDYIDFYMSDFLFNRYRKIASQLNYSDELEEEADRIALQLMSRACFDPRQAETFATRCEKMRTSLVQSDDKKENEEQMRQMRYMFEHAFNQQKISFLQNSMPKFIKFRNQCDCLPLK